MRHISNPIKYKPMMTTNGIKGLTLELEAKNEIDKLISAGSFPFREANNPISVRKKIRGKYGISYEFDLSFHGRDCFDRDLLFVCECKNCKKRITPQQIQFFLFRMNEVKCSGGCFITSSELTRSSMILAIERHLIVAYWDKKRCQLNWLTTKKMKSVAYPRKKKMSKYCALATIFLLLLMGCTKKIYVPVENVISHTDTLVEYVNVENNIYSADSVVIETRGDTVYKNAWRIRIRDRMKTDTIVRVRCDTIRLERVVNQDVTSESKGNRWLTVVPWVLAAVLMIILVIILVRR